MAVEQLNNFLISYFNDILILGDNLSVKLSENDDTFELMYSQNLCDSIEIKSYITINEINSHLKSKLYKYEDKDISFRVTKIICKNDAPKITVLISYTWIRPANTYFELLPMDLIPMVLCKLVLVGDIQSIAYALNFDTKTTLWRELLRYTFPQVYLAYSELNIIKYITMKTYVTFYIMKLSVGMKITNYRSGDYLDYFTIMYYKGLRCWGGHLGEHDTYLEKVLMCMNYETSDVIIVYKIILYLKYPSIYKLVKNNVMLKENLVALYHILSYHYINIEEHSIVWKFLEGQIAEILHCLHRIKILNPYIQYILLLSIDYKCVDSAVDIHNLLNIFSIVSDIDKKCGTGDAYRRDYLGKIKLENIELFNVFIAFKYLNS